LNELRNGVGQGGWSGLSKHPREKRNRVKGSRYVKHIELPDTQREFEGGSLTPPTPFLAFDRPTRGGSKA
jgi:hypothetical protein